MAGVVDRRLTGIDHRISQLEKNQPSAFEADLLRELTLRRMKEKNPYVVRIDEAFDTKPKP